MWLDVRAASDNMKRRSTYCIGQEPAVSEAGAVCHCPCRAWSKHQRLNGRKVTFADAVTKSPKRSRQP
ncbi:hypothetical protein JOB18_041765 [Solea senegalensis]|uniref:Uncharacterized protein n=1 Tax=Solea senegalensis TaxID=28829 RepID=A0AAV6RDZ2_SOLSE|nr:hypothetical protein JOB18_041765 [Solea senegalensis]